MKLNTTPKTLLKKPTVCNTTEAPSTEVGVLLLTKLSLKTRITVLLKTPKLQWFASSIGSSDVLSKTFTHVATGFRSSSRATF